LSSTGRTSFVTLAAVLAFGACSLLSPSDDELLGGSRADRSVPDTSLGGSDAEPDVSQEGAPPDVADHFSPDDAIGDVTEAESAADADDDSSSQDGSDAIPSCTDAADCAPGSFCNPLGRCRSCSDPATLRNLDELEYGSPEPLTAINAAAGQMHLRYPRAFDATSRLVYQRDFFGAQIWLSPDMLRTPGIPLASPIDVPNVTEGAALRFKPDLGPLAPYDFFYFAEVNHGDERSPYTLFGAVIDDFGYASLVKQLPAPFNADPAAGRWNFGLALSQTRAIWSTSDGGLLVQLVTARLDETATTVLSLPDANGCRPNQLEWAPWLTKNGRVLFFNAIERTKQCQLAGQFPGDIYVVGLDESGKPTGPAAPLRGISSPGTMELDGSLSFDQCWLYYSGATKDGQRLFRARRIR
jgi:hypothetical protein